MTCSARTFWCLVITLGVLYRLAMAATVPIVADESYQLTVASTFSWSFFDHPPLSFWAIDAVYSLTGTIDPFVLRIPALALGFGSLALIYALGTMVGGPNVGRIAALIWVLAPRWSRSAGVYAVPDPFLCFFTLLCVWFVARTFIDQRPSKWLWVGAGFALAGALVSKYHAVPLVGSALLFAICHPRGREWFKQPGPYIACAIALLGLMPVLIWNLQHDWASLRFHGGRAWTGIDLGDFYNTLYVETVGFLSAAGVVVLLCGIVYALKHRRGDPVVALLLFLSLPMLIVFHAIFFFSNAALPHWTLPFWMLLLPFAGLWLASVRLPRVVIAIVVALQTAAAATELLVYVQTHTDRYDAAIHWITRGASMRVEFDHRKVVAALEEAGHLDGDTVIAIPGWVRGGLLGAAMRPAGIDLSRIRIVPTHLGPEDVALGGRRYRMRYAPNHFRFLAGASASGPAIYINPVLYPASPNRELREIIGQRQLDAAHRLYPDFRELPPIFVKRGNTPHIKVYLGTFDWPEDDVKN